MSFKIVRSNIVNMQVDAIVNTANPEPTYMNGVDRAVYEAAGKEILLERRREIGVMNVSDVRITLGYNLPAKKIIHTVGPKWIDGKHGEIVQLQACYNNAIDLAKKEKIKSIAFPLISSGVNGVPKNIAIRVALVSLQGYMCSDELEVYLVVLDEITYNIIEKCMKVDCLENEEVIVELLNNEYVSEDENHKELKIPQGIYEVSTFIDEKLINNGYVVDTKLIEPQLPFRDVLNELIKNKNKSYEKIGLDGGLSKSMVSDIVNGKKSPSKESIFRLAIGLETSRVDFDRLITSAGFAINYNDEYEKTIMEEIYLGHYDLGDIDVILENKKLKRLVQK